MYVDGLGGLFSRLPAAEGKGEEQGVEVLRSGRGEDIERDVRGVVEELKSGGGDGHGGDGRGGMGKGRVVLVLDQPDLVLAAMGTGTCTGGAEDVGVGMGMGQVVASLRRVCLLSYFLWPL